MEGAHTLSQITVFLSRHLFLEQGLTVGSGMDMTGCQNETGRTWLPPEGCGVGRRRGMGKSTPIEADQNTKMYT